MKIKYVIPAIVSLFIVFAYFSMQNHEAISEEKLEFFINKPYIVLVKELATKNSLEKMVQENNGSIKSKEWEFFEVEVPQRILRIKDYKLNGKLNFVVEKTDPDLGKLELPFVQDIHLDNTMFSVKTKLESQQEKVVEFNKDIEMTPVLENDMIEGKTHVAIVSKLIVRKKIPFFAKNIMDEKVKKSNLKDVERIKSNIMNASGAKVSIHWKLRN